MGDNRPLHTISYGAIRITVWSNPTDIGVFYNVVASRSYRKDDNWHDSSSFAEFDLPLLAKGLLDAHTWIQAYKNTDHPGIALPPLPNRTDDDSGYDG